MNTPLFDRYIAHAESRSFEDDLSKNEGSVTYKTLKAKLGLGGHVLRYQHSPEPQWSTDGVDGIGGHSSFLEVTPGSVENGMATPRSRVLSTSHSLSPTLSPLDGSLHTFTPPAMSPMKAVSLTAALPERSLISRHAPRRAGTSAFRILEAQGLLSRNDISPLAYKHENMLTVALATTAYIWSPTHGISTLYPADVPVTSVDMTSDGECAVVGLDDGYIKAFRMTPTGIRTLASLRPHHQHSVSSVSVTSSMLVSAGLDGSLQCTDLRSMKLAWEVRVHTPIRQMRGCLDGSHYALVSDLGLTVHHMTNLRDPLLVDTSKEIRGMAWSPHTPIATLCYGTGLDLVIRKLDGVSSHSHPLEAPICDVQWSPRANEIVIAHGHCHEERKSRAVAVYDVSSKFKCSATLRGHQEDPLYMCLSPSGSEVVTAAPGIEDCTLRFWDLYAKKNGEPRTSHVFNDEFCYR